MLRLKPDDIAKIDKAMTEADGSRAGAAKLLGVAYVQISQAISRHPILRASWLQKDDNYITPVESDSPRLTNRHPPLEVSVKTDDEIRAGELTKIENRTIAVGPDKALSRSLHKLGFRAAEVEKLLTVEEFAGQHFTKTLSLMHGGVVKASIRAMLLLEKIEEEYLQDENLSEKDRIFYWDVYFRLLESLRALGSQADKAAITRALINQRKNAPGLGKPGFTAVQVNISKEK